MRIIATLIVLATLNIQSAGAQSAPITGVGPYQFGMTKDAANAVDPSVPLKPVVETPPAGVFTAFTAPKLQIFGRANDVNLLFQNNILTEVLLTHRLLVDDAAGCAREFETDIGSIESKYGALPGPGGPWEAPGIYPDRKQTAGGSEIRRYEEPRTRAVEFAASMPEKAPDPTAKAAPYIAEVTGMFLPFGGCMVVLDVRNDYYIPLDYTGFPPPPTDEEFAQVVQSEAQWKRKPTIEELMDFYPTFALAHAIPGRVTLDCLLNADETLRCRVTEEAPANKGFGVAALKAANVFRVGGKAGSRITIPLRFQPPTF